MKKKQKNKNNYIAKNVNRSLRRFATEIDCIVREIVPFSTCTNTRDYLITIESRATIVMAYIIVYVNDCKKKIIQEIRSSRLID